MDDKDTLSSGRDGADGAEYDGAPPLIALGGCFLAEAPPLIAPGARLRRVM